MATAVRKIVPDRLLISDNDASPADRVALIEMIRDGLPVRTVEKAASAIGLDVGDLVTFGVVPQRTLSHSRKTGRFSQAQSDRVARLFRVWSKAQETFGDRAKARLWMERPTRPLSGKSPMQLLDTESGARLVEELLYRIDHGEPA